jgi:hypothetical protein
MANPPGWGLPLLIAAALWGFAPARAAEPAVDDGRKLAATDAGSFEQNPVAVWQAPSETANHR